MVRYEANRDGSIEPGNTYTEYNEQEVLETLWEQLGWSFELIGQGRGGYLHYSLDTEEQHYDLHLYLKRLSFGGRDNRPREKRAQFSAGLDRRGFDVEEEDGTLKLILATYKRELYDDTILCAWSIHDWGYNVGRAFNCFVDVDTVAQAFEKGLVQKESAAGQIVCCFQPERWAYYLQNKDALHEEVLPEEWIQSQQPIREEDLEEELDEVPPFQDLFQYVIDSLKAFEGTATIQEMEEWVGITLNLSQRAKKEIHNPAEGSRTVLGYRLAWARNYLKHIGLVEMVKRGVWRLTEAGWDAEPLDQDTIMREVVNREVQRETERDIETDSQSDEIEADAQDPSVIEHPFDPNDVKIQTRPTSLDNLLKRLEHEEIDLDTDFQRQAGLWDPTKQSRLIESILIKFPLPAFYFDGSDDECWLVVDGLQRLFTLDRFVNRNELRLQNLEFLNHLNGYTYNELPGNLQRRIREFQVTIYLIEPGTPKYLKYIVFNRVNTGGLILSEQEIRHALNQGVPAKFVFELAQLRSFKEATTWSIPTHRMLDREFVTRFLAFYLFPLSEYDGDLGKHLNKAMEEIGQRHLDNKEAAEQEREHITRNFAKAMRAASALFGEHAFRKRYAEGERRKPINKALFDVWSVTLAKMPEAQLDRLINRRVAVQNELMQLMNEDEDFHTAISSATGAKNRVQTRFGKIENLIQFILDS